jgi:hypothetical protein
MEYTYVVEDVTLFLCRIVPIQHTIDTKLVNSYTESFIKLQTAFIYKMEYESI